MPDYWAWRKSMSIEIVAILCGIAVILSTVALVIACLGLSIIVGLKNSTHQIQYVPVEPDETDEELEARKVNQLKAWEEASGIREEEEDWL